jgi:outer membrane protein assembly factor BamC
MRNVNRLPSISPVRAATLALAMAALSGCSSVDNLLSGDKVDYRTKAKKSSSTLEVPPDLTQLARDGRYQSSAGAVSATTYQSAAAAALGNPAAANAGAGAQQPTVAPQQVGSVRVERAGDTRWLVSNQTPEQLWPQLQAFWEERGLQLSVNDAQAGVMETEWAENRSKLPQDIIRNTIGKVLDSVYDTGERDKYRTRIERTPQGTEIYISHRGMEEVLVGQSKDQTVWRPRAGDPQLEAEMLSRLMVKLGSKEADAKAAVAAAAAKAAPASTPLSETSRGSNARIVAGQPGATLQLDDAFDRAWRRVGLSLDRSGFTVEDRDRTAGLYYVRYADPKMAGKEEPGFFSKLFSFGSKDKAAGSAVNRYRISVKAAGAGSSTLVTVLNPQGQPDNTDVAQRIINVLVDDLK